MKTKIYKGFIKGELLVISDEYSKNKSVFVDVQCSCGVEYTIDRWRLINKATMCKNCAIKRDLKSEAELKLKILYSKIKQRIANPWNNPKNECYKDVVLCKEWEDSFEAFYEWSINNGWSAELSIDRIDPSLGYSPDNCRWATWIQQSQNRRKTKNNTTGYKSVYHTKSRGIKEPKNPYYSIVIYDGKRTYLSGFATAEGAYKARCDYIEEHYKGLVVP